MLHLAALLRAPRRVGAIAPSARALADAMAQEVPKRPGVVVELGAGTGSITAGILRSGVQASRLIVIEQDPLLCERLKRRFPQCKVVCGDARDLPAILSNCGPAEPAAAVVSSLPLLCLRLTERARLLRIVGRTIERNGPFIQYTYGTRCPISHELLQRMGATAHRCAKIWRNVPPATVWRLEMLGSASRQRQGDGSLLPVHG